jgi:single-stranded DNA-binding protein
LSVAIQRSWKNADENRWHRVVAHRPRLAEQVATTIKKSVHVLIEGSLVKSTYAPSNGKSKRAKAAKIISWSIRADVVRRLDCDKAELDAPNVTEAPESNEAPFHANSRLTLDVYAQALTPAKWAAHLKVVEMIRPTTGNSVVPLCSRAEITASVSG